MADDNVIEVTGNKLTFRKLSCVCSVGKGGFTADKVEGDGATPIGSYRLDPVVYYRADRVVAPTTVYDLRKIEPGMAWGDQPGPTYNQFISDAPAGHNESLWREQDHLYNLVVFVRYNADPVVPGRGSAIFIHLARNQDDPTATATDGCIGLKEADFRALLTAIDRDTTITIQV